MQRHRDRDRSRTRTHAARGGAARTARRATRRSATTDDRASCRARPRRLRALPRRQARVRGDRRVHALPRRAARAVVHRRAPRRAVSPRRAARDAGRGEPCTTCHPLDAKTGEVAIVGPRRVHAQCHADDFGARKPKICGACHNATEPWRHLAPIAACPTTTEFGAIARSREAPARVHELPRAAHARPRSCARRAATRVRRQRLSRGDGGPAPQLADCAACHALGLAPSARQARAQRAVVGARRVRSRAARRKDRALHDVPHRHDARDRRSRSPTPAKATCAPCHDGTRAFKLTGTTCPRCHGGERSTVMPRWQRALRDRDVRGDRRRVRVRRVRLGTLAASSRTCRCTGELHARRQPPGVDRDRLPRASSRGASAACACGALVGVGPRAHRATAVAAPARCTCSARGRSPRSCSPAATTRGRLWPW